MHLSKTICTDDEGVDKLSGCQFECRAEVG